MKIRTDIHAGADPLTTCQQQRDYWKAMATKMEAIAKTPVTTNPNPPPQPTPYPPTPPSGGGYVGGVWYSDRSGWCG